MRGELFEENEIVENEYPDYEEKLNPLFSDNVFELQKQHEILLQYIVELESKNIIFKEEIGRLKRRINYYERNEYENILQKKKEEI